MVAGEGTGLSKGLRVLTTGYITGDLMPTQHTLLTFTVRIRTAFTQTAQRLTVPTCPARDDIAEGGLAKNLSLDYNKNRFKQ